VFIITSLALLAGFDVRIMDDERRMYTIGCRVHYSADLSAVYFILWDIFPYKIMMRNEHLRLKRASFNWTLSHYTHTRTGRNRNGSSRSSNRMSLSIWWNCCYVFARLVLQISVLIPTIMTEVFHLLPWLLDADAGAIYQIGHGHFISHSFS
jgi:hypothetical protein